MNLRDLPQPVAKLVQIGLAAEGLYKGTFRGLPGPRTQAAYEEFLKKEGHGVAAPDALVTRFVEIARSLLGVHEEGGNNRGPMVEEIQRATWLEGTGWAWCAAYVCWCFLKLGAEYSLPFPRPRGAGAFWFEDWARQVGVSVYSKRAKIKKGDLIIWDFSHISIATRDETKAGSFSEIAGNTDEGGSREGEGVYEKRHTWKSKIKIRSVVRWA